MNDLKKFEDLYNEYFVYLSLSSFQITKDMEASKDIVQDYFIYLWNTNKKIIKTEGFKPYSYKAIKNLSLKHIEKVNRETAKNEIKELGYFEHPTDADNVNHVKAAQIYKLLDKVPLSRKNIFISHIINGLSYVEIAENQNISVNTVKTQMKRVYAFIHGEINSNTLLFLLLIIFKNKL